MEFILDTNVNSLNVALENVTASESNIRDADFASETAALARAQVLVQANTAVLAQANTTPITPGSRRSRKPGSKSCRRT